MRAALASANTWRRGIDYINAHGTATRQNDAVETAAIKEVFGARAFCDPVEFDKVDAWSPAGGRRRSGIRHFRGLYVARDCTAHHAFDAEDPDCDLDYVSGKAYRGRAAGGHVQFLRIRRHQRGTYRGHSAGQLSFTELELDLDGSRGAAVPRPAGVKGGRRLGDAQCHQRLGEIRDRPPDAVQVRGHRLDHLSYPGRSATRLRQARSLICSVPIGTVCRAAKNCAR